MFDRFLQFGRTALVDDAGRSLSYAQLQEESDKLKPCLQKGDLVFCLCTNTIECLIGYVALLQKGVATVLLDAHKDKGLLTRLAEKYRPNLVWSPSDSSTGTAVMHVGGYALSRYSAYRHSVHPDVALLLTTSGSTGSPKLVKLTARNLESNAEAIAAYLRIDANERPITTLPMYYSFGMSVINSHLVRGATILLTDATLMQKEFWTFLKEGKATSMAGVPYTYEMLKRLRFFQMDLPFLKTMVQAGGKLNAEIVKEFILDSQKKGREFIVMYGQTEAGPRMSWLPFEHAAEKSASIGIAIPGGRLSVRDAADQEIVVPNVDGELVFEGPGVCMGYAECPEDLAKGDENQGVLHTGDIAHFDEDGFFYISGRMKRFVKVWGHRCSLDATEQLVKDITTRCACVGVDDKITIFVVEQGLEAAIVRHLSSRMGLHASAFAVRVIADIPKKDTGKIDYPALQTMINRDGLP